MARLESLLNDVMDRALHELEQKHFPLHTLAFYLDHESAAVSVCADTQPNSDHVVASSNKYNLKYFLAGVRDGDLGAAALWQANIGRSLSLGDFTAVNLARTDLGSVPADAALCLGMVETIINNYERIRRLSVDPMKTALAASTLDDEVGLVWSLPSAEA